MNTKLVSVFSEVVDGVTFQLVIETIDVHFSTVTLTKEQTESICIPEIELSCHVNSYQTSKGYWDRRGGGHLDLVCYVESH
jgi:hypothetical protein